MTDAEIAKANAHFEYGIKCDIFSEPVLSYAETVLEAFDLINRQKAKIEELSEVLSDTIRIRYAEAKAEAIKEFAERLKEECSFECDVSLGYGRPCYEDAVPIIAIDNLVKEMAGEDNV